jgi:uncharacterized Fe-S center protein
MQEKIVEYAKGALAGKDGKAAFFNFLLNVTPDCDCWHFSEAPIVPDVGILASTDPVAIEQASVDLVARARPLDERVAGEDGDKFAKLTGVDGTPMLAYAERLGLGSREYELIHAE